MYCIPPMRPFNYYTIVIHANEIISLHEEYINISSTSSLEFLLVFASFAS